MYAHGRARAGKKLNRGSRSALDAAVKRFTPYVSAVILRALAGRACREEVAELCADVLMALWANAPGLDPEQGLRPCPSGRSSPVPTTPRPSPSCTSSGRTAACPPRASWGSEAALTASARQRAMGNGRNLDAALHPGSLPDGGGGVRRHGPPPGRRRTLPGGRGRPPPARAEALSPPLPCSTQPAKAAALLGPRPSVRRMVFPLVISSGQTSASSCPSGRRTPRPPPRRAGTRPAPPAPGARAESPLPSAGSPPE